jgi:hypothetical protein
MLHLTCHFQQIFLPEYSQKSFGPYNVAGTHARLSALRIPTNFERHLCLQENLTP